MKPPLLHRAQKALFRPVDVAFLAAFRFLFGAVMCVSMLRFIAYGWMDPTEPPPHIRPI